MIFKPGSSILGATSKMENRLRMYYNRSINGISQYTSHLLMIKGVLERGIKVDGIKVGVERDIEDQLHHLKGGIARIGHLTYILVSLNTKVVGIGASLNPLETLNHNLSLYRSHQYRVKVKIARLKTLRRTLFL
jgi:hypothetical protein